MCKQKFSRVHEIEVKLLRAISTKLKKMYSPGTWNYDMWVRVTNESATRARGAFFSKTIWPHIWRYMKRKIIDKKTGFGLQDLVQYLQS